MKSWLSYLSPNAGNPKSKIWVGHKMHTSGPTQVPALNKLLFDSASQCLVSETSYHEVAIRPRSPALVHRIYFFFLSPSTSTSHILHQHQYHTIALYKGYPRVHCHHRQKRKLGSKGVLYLLLF